MRALRLSGLSGGGGHSRPRQSRDLTLQFWSRDDESFNHTCWISGGIQNVDDLDVHLH
jgi:hypothetical protein